MAKQKRRRRNAPVVYLDEIDVIQMAFDAIRDFPKENFGLLLGTRNKRGSSRKFRIHFVQIVPSARNTGKGLLVSDNALKSFKQSYDFEVVGDFHSHPNPEIQKDIYSSWPSHGDLKDALQDYGYNSVITIIHVLILGEFPWEVPLKNSELPVEKTVGKIVKLRNKIRCILDVPHKRKKDVLSRFRVDINFYTFRKKTNAIPVNKKRKSFVRRVYPKLIIRKKIHRKAGLGVVQASH